MSLENALLGYIASKMFSFRSAHDSVFWGNFIVTLECPSALDICIGRLTALYKRRMLTYTLTTNYY